MSGPRAAAPPDAELVAVIDDAPIWSAPFGAAILERVRLRPGLVALDVGCGAGFPAVELANRLGRGARVIGVDLWQAALARVRRKGAAQGLAGLAPIRAAAEALPLADASVDLVLSCNGLSNVAGEAAAFAEVGRVARPGAQLAIAWNLPGTMAELYRELAAILAARGIDAAGAAIAAHVHAKRKPVDHVLALVDRCGFRDPEVALAEFPMRFASGGALLDHFLIRIGFLPAWEALAPAAARGEIFAELESRLDAIAARDGEVRLAIPFACVTATRR